MPAIVSEVRLAQDASAGSENRVCRTSTGTNSTRPGSDQRPADPMFESSSHEVDCEAHKKGQRAGIAVTCRYWGRAKC